MLVHADHSIVRAGHEQSAVVHVDADHVQQVRRGLLFAELVGLVVGFFGGRPHSQRVRLVFECLHVAELDQVGLFFEVGQSRQLFLESAPTQVNRLLDRVPGDFFLRAQILVFPNLHVHFLLLRQIDCLELAVAFEVLVLFHVEVEHLTLFDWN